MAVLPTYSPFFSCVYDEQEPVGQLGRGTHYSVLRTAEWFDVDRSPLDEAQVHDLAVIWDEDHDERVVPVIEQIYMNGLLSPVQFIGERKGMLTVILASRFYLNRPHGELEEYEARIKEISQKGPYCDVWTLEIGCFNREHHEPPFTCADGIISDSEDRVITYLRNIDSLWSLGTKLYNPNLHTASALEPVII